MTTRTIDTGSQMIFSPRNLVTFDAAGYPEIEDLKAAEKLALRERNAEAKRLRKAGHTVGIFSLGTQLVSFGGIGSGKPHCEMLFKAYGLNYR